MIEQILANQIGTLTIELAKNQVLASEYEKELKPLRELKNIIDSNKELSELVEEIKNDRNKQ